MFKTFAAGWQIASIFIGMKTDFYVAINYELNFVTSSEYCEHSPILSYISTHEL